MLLRVISKEWYFRVGSCHFCKILTNSYLSFTDYFSFWVKDTTKSIYGRCFLFWRLRTSFSTTLFFGVTCSENLRQLLLCYKRFPNVTRKSREIFPHLSSVQQVVLNHRNRNCHSVRTLKNRIYIGISIKNSKTPLKLTKKSSQRFSFFINFSFPRSDFEVAVCLICIAITIQWFSKWKL